MNQPLEIVEVIERSAQGLTRPYLCRCADDNLYYVKGRGAGHRSLICEWVAGRLAREFGLPVPVFEIVQDTNGLSDVLPDGSDLGGLPAFGSRVVPHVQELAVAHVANVPENLRKDVLVFDRWIQNQDRTLTSLGGNPNLLWDAAHSRLAVIDHNVAFDDNFSMDVFRTQHVFSADAPSIFQDLAECGVYSRRLSALLEFLPAIRNEIPNEWLHVDVENSIRTDFDFDVANGLLGQCRSEQFWRQP